MTLEEFKELLDVYGSDLGQWPEAHRIAALALIDESDAAKTAFADAGAFDAVLRSGKEALSQSRRDALIDDILSAVGNEPGKSRTDSGEPPTDTVMARRLADLLAEDAGASGRAGGAALRHLVDRSMAAVLAGDRLAAARSALDQRQRSGDDRSADQATDCGTLPSTESPDAAGLAVPFLAGDLTDRMAAAYAAARGIRAGLLLGSLVDLSARLDRDERRRFLTILTTTLPE